MDEPTWRDARDAIYWMLVRRSNDLFEQSQASVFAPRSTELAIQAGAMDMAAAAVLEWEPAPSVSGGSNA